MTKKEKRALAKEEKRKAREKEDMNSKFKKGLILLVVVGVLGWLGYRAYKFINTPTEELVTVPIELTDSERIKGDRNAEAILVEYSDFQCPACGSYFPIVKSLKEDFGDKLAVVYRHFPLVSIHANAMDAAKAAEAAGMQDRFWEMHDILFEKQGEWSSIRNPKDEFSSYAKDLGLDDEKFKSDFDSGEVQKKIDDDLLSANRLKLNSTPSFFLNSQQVLNPGGYEDLKAEIESVLASE